MNLSNIDAWQYLVAFFTPYLVALINRPSWSSDVKRWVMLGVAVVVALVTAALEGSFRNFNIGSILQYLVLMTGATQVAYTALRAIPVTKATLDKTEVVATGTPPQQAVRAKATVKDNEVADFEKNVL